MRQTPQRLAAAAALLCLLHGAATSSADTASGDEADVPLLDVGTMQQQIMKHDKFVLLMHTQNCARGLEFAPTLGRIAQHVPTLAYGRVIMESHPETRMAAATGVQEGAPALKAFFRNGPPQKRVLEYVGLPTFEAVLDWAKAVDSWDGSDHLAPGWEVGKPQTEEGKSRDQKTNAKAKETKDEM